MRKEFDRIKKGILSHLEELAGVKCAPEDYLTALEEIGDEVESWFEASKEAAKDDLQRAKGWPP